MALLALDPAGAAIVNVGVAEFALAPRAHGASVVQLDWRPPADGDRALGLLLARLEDDADDPVGARVRAANALAVERITSARPMLVGVRPAREVVDELLDHGILAGTSGDPNVVRLLPPLVLEASHVETLAQALGEIRA